MVIIEWRKNTSRFHQLQKIADLPEQVVEYLEGIFNVYEVFYLVN